MNDDTIQDLKQYIAATVSQQVSDVRFDIKELDEKLTTKIDDLSQSVADAMETGNEIRRQSTQKSRTAYYSIRSCINMSPEIPRSEHLGPLKSGLIGNKLCFPNEYGVYHATYQDASEVGIDLDTGEVYVGGDRYNVDCPRFRKCDQCPEIIGVVATKSLIDEENDNPESTYRTIYSPYVPTAIEIDKTYSAYLETGGDKIKKLESFIKNSYDKEAKYGNGLIPSEIWGPPPTAEEAEDVVNTVNAIASYRKRLQSNPGA